mgnify:FL=1
MTEEAQYWLGMLVADGYIGDKENTVGLSLQEKDLEHLNRYANFVETNIKSYLNKKFNIMEYRAYFKNKATNSWLKSIGVTERKSDNIKLLIPLTNHILRGIIDGDGYVRKGKGHIEIATQSDNLRLQIIEYLTSNDIHCTSHVSTSVFIVGIYRKDSIKKLYNLLYNNASIFLERKKDRITATLI